jgi:hypothetical protein
VGSQKKADIHSGSVDDVDINREIVLTLLEDSGAAFDVASGGGRYACFSGTDMMLC